MKTENEIVGRLFGEEISREQVEEWAEAFWEGTWGNIRRIWSGNNHSLIVFESGRCVVDDGSPGAYKSGYRTLLEGRLELPSEIDLEDDDDVASWEEGYEERKGDDINGWVEEIISNLDEIPEPSFIRLTDADSDNYDVQISDGVVTSYFHYPSGVDAVSEQEAADFYLSGYDGEGEIQFIVGYACDADEDGNIRDWTYASGLPDRAAEIHYGLAEGKKKIWLC